MRALQIVLTATFALAHGVLMPWHLAVAHHTNAASLLDVHFVLAAPHAETTAACEDDHDPHATTDHHHHGTPHDPSHTLEHAADAVKTRPAPFVAPELELFVALEVELELPHAGADLVVVELRLDEATPPLGPPGPSPLRPRGPPRV
jgi:hypothetical protein